MIITPLRGTVQKPSGFDLYGQPKLTSARPFSFAAVKLKFIDQHTTVRTDSAGSHGHAIETAADVIILVQANSGIAANDILTIVGHKVKVTASHPRFSVAGKLDHYQLDCVAEV